MTLAEMTRMGGLARAKKLSRRRRIEIARDAAHARWNKRKAGVAARQKKVKGK